MTHSITTCDIKCTRVESQKGLSKGFDRDEFLDYAFRRVVTSQ